VSLISFAIIILSVSYGTSAAASRTSAIHKHKFCRTLQLLTHTEINPTKTQSTFNQHFTSTVTRAAKARLDILFLVSLTEAKNMQNEHRPRHTNYQCSDFNYCKYEYFSTWTTELTKIEKLMSRTDRIWLRQSSVTWNNGHICLKWTSNMYMYIYI